MPEGVQVTEQGVFIPRQVYQNFGEIEIVFANSHKRRIPLCHRTAFMLRD